nr:transporter substrate-binding domain-containing protein [Spirochaetales bacterium]
GRVVAVKSGTTGALEAQKRLPKAVIRIFEEVAACVLEVSQGKADAFIYDALTVYNNHKNNSNTTRINLESIPGTDGYWGMAIKKGNTELLARVNSFIKSYQEEGGFSALANTYLNEEKQIFDEAGIPFFFDIK